MGIHFSYPEYLLLLPLAWFFTWWVAGRSLADLDRSRRRLSIGFRVAIFTILILALAGFQFVRPTKSLCTIFVVDVSDSIAPAARNTVLGYIHAATQRMHGQDGCALIAFGAEALLDHAPEDKQAIQKIVSLPGTSRTNIAAGIQLAMASFPQEMGKQIILFTDGNENEGNALDQTDLAQNGNIHLSVVSLQRDTSQGEALLLSANAPTEVHQGAPIPISVVAESLQETDGTITLYRNNAVAESRRVHLRAGKSVVTFEPTLTESGVGHFHAVLDVPAQRDTVPDNNTADVYTRVTGKPTVLIVEDKAGDGAQLARALQASDLQVELGGPDRLPRSLAECGRYDSIVLANVPAWHMSPMQMNILRSAVHDSGMGLAMIGGEESFAAGGYLHTPIEEALPVNMEPKRQQSIPTLTLVIAIDVSGSMGIPEDGIPKVRLAAEAAAAAVDLLQPIDRVCVFGFDTRPTYVVNMTRADNKASLVSQIHRLEAGGGGILAFSALNEAHRAMGGASTQVKHIILCADAQDTEEKEGCLALAARLKQEHITLSVIGFGQLTDPDVVFHHELAATGGGKSYLAERLSNLPQIFTRDVLNSSQSLFEEKPFRPVLTDTTHPLLGNLSLDAAPPLLGYVVASMKDSPSARQLLSSPKKDPVLAAWSYGLGRSLAFTSDATTHWGALWTQWPDYSTFWAQSLRWTLRKGGTTDFRTTVTEDHGRAYIVVEAVTPEGEYRNLLHFHAHVAHVASGGIDGPQSTSDELPLEQTASGRYEASFAANNTGAYQVTVEEREGDSVKGLQSATLVIPYSPEFQALQPNRTLLAQLVERAHGSMNPEPDDIFGRLRFGARTLRDLWGTLVVLLVVLFIGDVTVRRVLLPWQECVSLARQGVHRVMSVRRTRAREATEQPTVVSPLLEKREQAKQHRTAAPSLASALREAVKPSVVMSNAAGHTPEAAPVEQAEPTVAASSPTQQPARGSQALANRLLQKKRERDGSAP